jgi:hypothetical protein
MNNMINYLFIIVGSLNRLNKRKNKIYNKIKVIIRIRKKKNIKLKIQLINKIRIQIKQKIHFNITNH